MLDTKIVGGMVIDGLGGQRRRADIGIAGGRIQGVGVVNDQAARTIDATGLVIAPGFIDTHTHYDAQVSWDPSLAPAALHGVTSVIGGNCGFTVAPIDEDAASYVERMLARVEGMPIEALTAGVPWNWRSFGDWLDQIDAGLAVNAGFLVGHSTIRRVVMGARAVGDQAGDEDLARMVQLVEESLADGALGLSSSRALSHHDGDGDPVPSRFASVDELVALAMVVGRHPGAVLALNPGVATFDDGDVALMSAMSAAADRLLNWNALLVDSARAEVVSDALRLSDRVSRAGGQVVAQVAADPRRFYLSFTNGFLLDTLPGWAPLFGLSPSARRAALTDPATRQMLPRRRREPPLRRRPEGLHGLGPDDVGGDRQRWTATAGRAGDAPSTRSRSGATAMPSRPSSTSSSATTCAPCSRRRPSATTTRVGRFARHLVRPPGGDRGVRCRSPPRRRFVVHLHHVGARRCRPPAATAQP